MAATMTHYKIIFFLDKYLLPTWNISGWNAQHLYFKSVEHYFVAVEKFPSLYPFRFINHMLNTTFTCSTDPNFGWCKLLIFNRTPSWFVASIPKPTCHPQPRRLFCLKVLGGRRTRQGGLHKISRYFKKVNHSWNLGNEECSLEMKSLLVFWWYLAILLWKKHLALLATTTTTTTTPWCHLNMTSGSQKHHQLGQHSAHSFCWQNPPR